MPNVPEQFRKVAIVGPGLLGASVGLGLKRIGYTGEILGVSRREETLQTAIARGAIDVGSHDIAGTVGSYDLIIIATPLGAFKTVFENLAGNLKDNACITDVGSTKVSVVQTAMQCLSDDSIRRFVPAHPMAGSEQQGPEAATDTLLLGRPCILTPGSETADDAVANVRSFWQAMGMNVLTLSPEEHDRKCAAVSHLPHLLAVLLSLYAKQENATQVASTGFRDMTRLSASNPNIRADILDQNRQSILDAIDGFKTMLEFAHSTIQSGDNDAVRQLLDDASSFRDEWMSNFNANGREGSST